MLKNKAEKIPTLSTAFRIGKIEKQKNLLLVHSKIPHGKNH